MREMQTDRGNPYGCRPRVGGSYAAAIARTMVVLGAAIGLARPAGASTVPDSLRACAQEQDDGKRLACFDHEVARLTAKAERSIGLTGEQERKLDVKEARQAGAPAASSPPASKSQRLSASIADVVRRGDGRCVITLDNGQVWLQGEAYENFDAKAGDAVSIRSGLLGAFYMHTASGADTRVTRQR